MIKRRSISEIERDIDTVELDLKVHQDILGTLESRRTAAQADYRQKSSTPFRGDSPYTELANTFSEIFNKANIGGHYLDGLFDKEREDLYNKIANCNTRLYDLGQELRCARDPNYYENTYKAKFYGDLLTELEELRNA